MKKTDWIDVIGKIDPAYVKEAEQWSKAAQKKRNLKHFTAMAACVCILLAGAVVSFDLWVQNKDTGAETESAVAEGMNEGASAPNEGNETAVAKAEEEQTESVESESFADTDEQITINEVSELTTIAIDGEWTGRAYECRGVGAVLWSDSFSQKSAGKSCGICRGA